MYSDLYLKFADQAEADLILYTVHPEEVDDEGVIIVEAYTTPNYANIDTIGVIFEETGETVTDTEGNESPVLEQVPGYHVNVRVVGSEVSDDLEPFAVQPKTPLRVWG